MTVKELIEELKKYPEDMPVAISGDVEYPIEVNKKTWVDSNYPWNRPDFEYINLE